MNQTPELKDHTIIKELLFFQGIEFDKIGYAENLIEENSLLTAFHQYADLRITIPEIEKLVNEINYASGYLPSPVRADIEKWITKLKSKL